MGATQRKATMVLTTQLNTLSSYTHPASSHMTYSRVYNVTNALHLGEGPICVETTPQHGSMLSANLAKYQYGSWLNMSIWTKTDANYSCPARGYGVQIANPSLTGTTTGARNVTVATGAWFKK